MKTRAPMKTPTAAAGVNIMKMGQCICCLNDRIRAIKDGMFKAACIGIATASGSTEELVASMI